MGVSDTIDARPRCCGCSAEHQGFHHTAFLRPSQARFHRHFQLGEAQPVDLPVAELRSGKRWDEEWFPVASWQDGPLRLLTDFEELAWCPCGLPLLPRFSFAVEPGRVTLVEVATWPLLSLADFAQVHFTDVWPMEWRFNPDGSATWDTQTPLEVRLARADALGAEERIRSIHRNLVLSTLERHARKRLGGRGLDLRRCLWCSPSWNFWIAETLAEGPVLLGHLGEWRLLRGPVDELVQSIPDEREFAAAVSALAPG